MKKGATSQKIFSAGDCSYFSSSGDNSM
ncbi:MAG: hypothetical protein EB161_09450, partial [Nitrosopumilaceae archaeon]|nr:hypothetical protein [Nitrosopumilaceae archaeon]